MKRLKKHLASSLKLLLVCLAVIAIAAKPYNSSSAAPKEQGNALNFTLSYQLIANPRTLSLCPGEQQKVQVFLQRTLTEVVGPEYTPRTITELIFGARVRGLSFDKNIADFIDRGGGRPPDEYSTISGPITAPRAWYVVKGGDIGTTTLQFSVINLPASETRQFPVRGSWPIDLSAATIDIEVTPCYEAYASALGQTWPTKDICSLEKPFLLEAMNENVNGLWTETEALFFWPSPRDIYRGWYVFVSKASNVPLVEVGSGNYSLDFYPVNPADNIERADITLDGHSVFCTMDQCFDVPYTGYMISIRSLPSGSVCEDSLP